MSPIPPADPPFRADRDNRRIDDAALGAAENRAVRDVVALQEGLGLAVVTYGDA